MGKRVENGSVRGIAAVGHLQAGNVGSVTVGAHNITVINGADIVISMTRAANDR